jgi:hypothetical protein
LELKNQRILYQPQNNGQKEEGIPAVVPIENEGIKQIHSSSG